MSPAGPTPSRALTVRAGGYRWPLARIGREGLGHGGQHRDLLVQARELDTALARWRNPDAYQAVLDAEQLDRDQLNKR
ncbi:hypothetical protein AB0H34_02980 [Saccharopolyspora shandongensis]|uniref:hypothetical protein n=1 Tax=Saccharopolyspora shandongensis TaxID=418495 RepID=UPI0034063402